jgi:hypothetical protein
MSLVTYCEECQKEIKFGGFDKSCCEECQKEKEMQRVVEIKMSMGSLLDNIEKYRNLMLKSKQDFEFLEKELEKITSTFSKEDLEKVEKFNDTLDKFIDYVVDETVLKNNARVVRFGD